MALTLDEAKDKGSAAFGWAVRHPYWVVLVVGLVLTGPVIWFGLPLGSDDAISHAFYSENFSHQLALGEWYPRWLYRTNGGLGSPTYFSYQPLPSYIAHLFSVLPIGIMNQLGAASAAGIILAGLATVLWVREISGERAGLVAGVIVMLMPYPAHDLYVRAAFGEIYTFLWMPLILFFTLRIAKGSKYAIPGLAVSYALLCLTHLPVTVIFSGIPIVYALFVADARDRHYSFAATVAAMLLGAGIAAAYIIPVAAYQNFAYLHELREGHFHYSFWLMTTDLAVRGVWAYFWMPVTVATAALGAFVAGILLLPPRFRRELVFWVFVLAGSFFMLLHLSEPIWASLTYLQAIQFPFRFNTLITLAALPLIGLAVSAIRRPLNLPSKLLLVVLAGVCLYWANDFRKVAGNAFAPRADWIEAAHNRIQRLQIETHGRWPRTAPFSEADLEKKLAKIPMIGDERAKAYVTSPAGTVSVLKWQPREIELNVNSTSETTVSVSQFYFPAWRARIAGGEQELPIRPSPELGLISITVPPGNRYINVTLDELGPEFVAEWISISSILFTAGFFFLLYYRRRVRSTAGTSRDATLSDAIPDIIPVPEQLTRGTGSTAGAEPDEPDSSHEAVSTHDAERNEEVAQNKQADLIDEPEPGRLVDSPEPAPSKLTLPKLRILRGIRSNRHLIFWRLSFLLAVLFLYAIYLNGITTNPPGLYLDESLISYQAYSISQSGRSEAGEFMPVYFGAFKREDRTFDGYVNPTYVYGLAVLNLFIAPSPELSRVYSATLIFLACLLLGWLAFRMSDNAAVGVVTAVTAAITPWFFEIGRLVFEAAIYPLALALFLFALFRAHRSQKWNIRHCVSVAIGLALVTYSYSIGRLLGPLFALGLLLFAINRNLTASVLKTYLIYAILLTPIGVFIYRNPGAMTERYNDLSVYKPEMPLIEKVSAFAQAYLSDVGFDNLIIIGDPLLRHHIPVMGMLFAASVAVGLGGIAIALRRGTTDPWYRYLIFGIVVSIVPGALTFNRSHSLRLVAFPVFLTVLSVPLLSWLLSGIRSTIVEEPAADKQPIGSESRAWWAPLSQIKTFASAILFVSVAVQGYYFHAAFRTVGPTRLDDFDAAYPTILAEAVATESRPIYLKDGLWGPAYIHAYFYSAVHGIDPSNFIHLSRSQTVPSKALVLSSDAECLDCDILSKRRNYLLYRTK